MKKVVMAIVIIALVGVSVSAYIMYSNNQEVKDDLRKREVDLEETTRELEDMEEAFSLLIQESNQKDIQISDLEDQVATKDIEVTNLTASLDDAEESLIAINAALGTLGDPVKGIESLIAEIDDLKKTIETMNEDNTSEDETQEVVTEPESNVDAVDYSSTFSEWVSILEQADRDLANRIDELDATIEPLPALSLERILIQTEIDFLVEIRSDIDGVRADIASQ